MICFQTIFTHIHWIEGKRGGGGGGGGGGGADVIASLEDVILENDNAILTFF